MGSVCQTVGFELLSQGAPVDPENLRSLALIAAGKIQDGLEQWLFHLFQHQAIKLAGLVSVQMAEIGVEGRRRGVPQWPRSVDFPC